LYWNYGDFERHKQMAEKDVASGGRFGGGGGLASIARVANDARSMIEFCENLVECRCVPPRPARYFPSARRLLRRVPPSPTLL